LEQAPDQTAPKGAVCFIVRANTLPEPAVRMAVKQSLVGLLAAAFAVTPAVAAVSFDTNTGNGSVDSRDVRLALGWTEARLQERMLGVTFVFQGLQSVTAVCSWTAPGGLRGEDRRSLTKNTRSSLLSVPRFSVRNPKQIEGFTLSGYGRVLDQSDPVPVPGQPCVSGGGYPGAWSVVIPMSRSGRLFVESEGKSAPVSSY
jgi:hypothetical protein